MEKLNKSSSFTSVVCNNQALFSEMTESEISCNVVVEGLSKENQVIKRFNCRNGKLALWRNEFQEIVLSVDGTPKISNRYVLHDLKIHCKFMKEGKSTLILMDHNQRILLSNCPPGNLRQFLKLLSSKMANLKSKGAVSIRKKLMSVLPKTLDEISPLCEKDIAAVNALRQNSATESANATCRKRPLSDVTNQAQANPQAKRTAIALKSDSLDREQKHVISMIREGKNIFFTGSAGTGKSFLLKRIVDMLPPAHTAVTASTGVAACHIGGTTLHSFSGIGKGATSRAQCVQAALSKPSVVKRWKACRYLIVDEISMIDADYFDTVEAVARTARQNQNPFGGIQVILCGDFFQLPPVSRGKEKKKLCFQSSSWERCVEVSWELRKIYRQTDQYFINILQDLRIGRCDSKTLSTLKATRHNKIECGRILATKLCTHRDAVDQINQDELDKLSGKPIVFEAQDNCSAYSSLMNEILPDTKSITLKVGTQVMLTKNLDVTKGLVNGSRGIVTQFEKGSMQLPTVKFLCGLETKIKRETWIVKLSFDAAACRKQLPLKPAWAISIHKSQGMTLDCVEMSLSRVFENGQAYVALSRARALKGLRVLDFERSCVRSNVDVLRFYRKLRENQRCSTMFPLGV